SPTAPSLPTGVSVSFSTTTLAPGNTATMTVSATASAVNGDNVVTIKGAAAGLTRQAKGHATVSGGTTGGGGGGGCPPGSIDIGGVCIPIGCSTGAADGLSGSLLMAAAAALWMRRRRS